MQGGRAHDKGLPNTSFKRVAARPGQVRETGGSEEGREPKIYVIETKKNRPHCQVKFSLSRNRKKALIDTGAEISVVSESLFKELSETTRTGLRTGSKVNCKGASGERLNGLGEVELRFSIGARTFKHQFQVIRSLKAPVILGTDFLELNKAVIDYYERTLRLGNSTVLLNSPEEEVEELHYLVRTVDKVVLPSQTHTTFPCKVPRITRPGTYLVDFLDTTLGLTNKPGVSIPNTIIQVSTSRTASLTAVNETNTYSMIPKNAVVGTLTPLDPATIAPIEQTEETPGAATKTTISSQLTMEELEALDNLLERKKHLFTESDMNLGRTTLKKCDITTTTDQPIRQKPYKTPFHLRDKVEGHIENMLEAGIISPSTSPWSSPIVIVSKKNGETRFCVDYRKLNSVSVPNSYPLPNIDDVLAAFNGAKYFSKLDLKSGYFQIEMTEEAKPKTAFVTHMGLFQFNRLPFGLNTAPAVFQDCMNTALQGLLYKCCLCYLDDVIIFSKTVAEHLQHLEEVLDRIEKAGLMLRLSKCEFFKKQLGFLGHVISDEGIQPDAKKVSDIKDMSPPDTVTDVRAFIGMCSYYRRYVNGFSEIAEPLIALTRKNEPFVWTKERQEAFDELKTRLTQAPILAHPDPSKEYVLYTDASGTCVGAILAQKEHGGTEEKVIHYLSQQLNKTQRRWSTIEREAYAIVLALKKFRQYLLGTPFTVYCDHRPLKTLFKSPMKNMRIERWSILLSEYNCDIQYRPGRSMKADFVSRIKGPMPEGDEEGTEEDEERLVAHVEPIELAKESEEDEDMPEIAGLDGAPKAFNPEDLPTDINALKKLQSADPDIEEIMSSLQEEPETSQYAEEYVMDEGILYRIASPSRYDKEHRLQLVVSPVLIKGILYLMHDRQGHMGVDKTHDLIRRRYYWNNSYRDVLQYIQQCTKCNQRKLQAMKIPYQPTFVPSTPMSHLSMDLSGPFPESENGDRYILTVVCLLSGWIESFSIPNKETITVAKKLCEEVFPRHGYPQTLLSDRGTEFVSEVINLLSKKLGICRIKTLPYTPHQNAKSERVHRVLNDIIAKNVAIDQSDWPKYLPTALQAIRTTVHSGSKYSPFMLMYGRDPNLPLDYILRPKYKYVGEDYVPNLLQRLHHAYLDAKSNIMDLQKKNRDRQDRVSKQPKIEEGDLVFYKNYRSEPGLSKKWAPKWLPYYRVLEKRSPVNFLIKHTPSGETKEAHAKDLIKVDYESEWNKTFPDAEEIITSEESRRLGADKKVEAGTSQKPARRQPVRSCRLSIPLQQNDTESEEEMEVDTDARSLKRELQDTTDAPAKRRRLFEIVATDPRGVLGRILSWFY